MPFLDLPIETFGDLEKHDLEIQVGCQKCGQIRLVVNRAEALRDQGGALWQRAATGRACSLLLPNFISAGLSDRFGWPITRGDDHARNALSALRAGESVDLGAMPMVDLTRFLAFRLRDENEKATALFSTSLIMDGLPAEHLAAILRWVINSHDAYLPLPPALALRTR